jgi:cystathionine beta-synthase
VADEIVAVSDKDSFQMTRRLAKEEGLLVGGSCGMAVVAALEVAKRLGPDDVVVVLLPDGGRGYLSKIFNDDWMADYGFLPSETDEAHIAEVLARKVALQQGGIPQFVHMHPSETVGDAIKVLGDFGVSQMPVVSPGAGHPDIMAGEVIGSVVERELLNGLHAQEIQLADTLDNVMSKPLPVVGSGETVTSLVTVLEKADAAVVLVEGKPQGIVTRQDLLAFLAGRGGH